MPNVKEMQEHLKEFYKLDEPLFIIRAKDDVSLSTLTDYKDNARRMGASIEFCEAVADMKSDFESWRLVNEDKCRLPN